MGPNRINTVWCLIGRLRREAWTWSKLSQSTGRAFSYCNWAFSYSLPVLSFYFGLQWISSKKRNVLNVLPIAVPDQPDVLLPVCARKTNTEQRTWKTVQVSFEALTRCKSSWMLDLLICGLSGVYSIVYVLSGLLSFTILVFTVLGAVCITK